MSPAKVKSQTVTLPVSGGSLDPTNGLGTLEPSAAASSSRHGKKSAAVKALVLDTTTKARSPARSRGKKDEVRLA